VSVRIHRNLNHGPAWVVSPPNGGKALRRVDALTLTVEAVKVSLPTLQRMRTPRGELTPSGAQGLGRRTVGAWLIGEPVEGRFKATGSTVHFNPFKGDSFTLNTGDGEHVPLQVCEGETLTLRFNPCGRVEVVQ